MNIAQPATKIVDSSVLETTLLANPSYQHIEDCGNRSHVLLIIECMTKDKIIECMTKDDSTLQSENKLRAKTLKPYPQKIKMAKIKSKNVSN